MSSTLFNILIIFYLVFKDSLVLMIRVGVALILPFILYIIVNKKVNK